MGSLVSVRSGGHEIGIGVLHWDELRSRWSVGDLNFYTNDIAGFNETTKIVELVNQGKVAK